MSFISGALSSNGGVFLDFTKHRRTLIRWQEWGYLFNEGENMLCFGNWMSLMFTVYSVSQSGRDMAG